MRGPDPKPPERRQRPKTGNAPRSLRLAPVPANQVPAARKEWLKATRDEWSAFWNSDVSRIVRMESDLAPLERLFQLRDMRRRAEVIFRANPMVKGSTGQPVVNPIQKVMTDCDKEVRALEDRFGLTPMARLRLGSAFGDAARSLEEMNEGFERDPDPGPTEDPRSTVVVAPRNR